MLYLSVSWLHVPAVIQLSLREIVPCKHYNYLYYIFFSSIQNSMFSTLSDFVP